MSLLNLELAKKLTHGIFKNNLIKLIRCHSSVSVQKVDSDAHYPDIKPKYPPGDWGSMAQWKTWDIVKRREKFQNISDTKERLECMAGSDEQTIHEMLPSYSYPGEVLYKQFITKTHISSAHLDTVFSEPTDDAQLDKLVKLVELIVVQMVQKNAAVDTQQNTSAHADLHDQIWTRVIDVLVASLAPENDHLRLASYDYNVPVDAFCLRRLAAEERYDLDAATLLQRRRDRHYDQDAEGDEDMWTEMRTTQMRLHALYQIRTHQPLAQYLAIDDSLCTSAEYPVVKYDPAVVGQKSSEARPISQSGFWTGGEVNTHNHTGMFRVPEPTDPHQVHMNEPHQLAPTPVEDSTPADPSSMPTAASTTAPTSTSTSSSSEERWRCAAVVNGFTSCSAAAHNNGEQLYNSKLEQPVVSQQILVDGGEVRFAAYQLNTLQLWKDDTSDPLRNILFQSNTMRLYDPSTLKVSRPVVDFMLRLLTRKPSSPSCGTLDRPMKPLLNRVDTPPSQTKTPIGRWQYPRKPVYTYF